MSQHLRLRSVRGRLVVILNMLLILALACSLPNLNPSGKPPSTQPTQGLASPTQPPKPTPTQQPLPPALVQSEPAPGSEIPLAAPITFYFNQAMDHPSVESALSGQPTLAGHFTWVNDSTLSFQTDKPFLPETKLAVTINNSARSRQGMTLLNPLTLDYQTASYLRTTQVLPEADGNQVDPTSAVVVSFNLPVVPLGGDPASAPAAFSLEPAATGRGEWINTSTYIFYPDPALAGGATYHVKVNTGLASAQGTPLDQEHSTMSWSFSTAAPRLTSTFPTTGSVPVRLDAAMKMEFNQAMDQGSTESNFALLDFAGQPVPGKFAWDKNFTTLTYTPTALLQRNSFYSLTLNSEARTKGGTAIGTGTTVRFQTVGDLALVGSTPAPGGGIRPEDAITLTFTAPLADQDIKSRLQLKPPVSGLTDYLDPGGEVLHLSGYFAPATTYTLTLSASLEDPWGGTLGAPKSFTFQTTPAMSRLDLTQSTDTLFITPQDTTITVQTTNVDNINYSLGSTSLDDFLVMMGPSGYDIRQTYKPNDNRALTANTNAEANKSTFVELPITNGSTPLTPGLYYMRLSASGLQFNPAPVLLVVSNLNITFKMSATDTLVWVVDLRTNTPVKNTPITLYDEKGKVLTAGQTDQNGVYKAVIPTTQDPYGNLYAVTGKPGQDNFALAVSAWNQGISSWNFGIPTDYQLPPLKAYLYTDRPIYRPGQTVYFRGIIRKAANGRYAMPDASSYDVKLYEPQGKEISTFNLPIDSFGALHSQYEIPPNAAPGEYRLAIGDDNSLFFKIAQYRKPEINLQVSFDPNQLKKGQPLTAKVNARYFFDAPASNVPVHWTLFYQRNNFSLPGYQVGPTDYNWMNPFFIPDSMPFGMTIQEGDAKTDANGLLTVQLSSEFDLEKFTGVKETPGSLRQFTLEVTATDESGLPVSARASAEMHPGDYYIGVKPDVWSAQAGTPFGFSVQTANWDKNPAGVQALRAVFQKVTWERIPLQPGEPDFGPKYQAKYTVLSQTDFSSGVDGQARLAFTAPEAGVYQLDVKDRQGGDGPLTQVLVWVGGAGEPIWPDIPNQRLQMTADRDSYRPGDTAQIFIPNPFPEGGLALITVERGEVMSYQVVPVEGDGYTFSLPLTDDHAPNVYLAVTLIKKAGEGHKDFRQGYINIPVEPVAQNLHVALTSEPQRAGPGEPVTFNIQVTDAKGQPVQGEFSISVVDLAVLALADPNSPDILPAFYGNQPLGVRTGLDLAVYASRNVYTAGGLGGGGGGEGVSPVVRENFPDTAYWSAEVVTDANGQAQVKVTLPDSLTTWKIDVRGVSVDSRVGQAESQVITTKELLVRPVTPRFFVQGDHAQIAALVQNNTQGGLSTQVSLQATGFNLDDEKLASQVVDVPAGGRTRVEWWGTVQDVDSVELIFSAKSGGLEDATRPAQGSLPVYRYISPQTFATSGVIDEAGQRLEVVSIPPGALTSSGGPVGDLRLELSPSLAAAAISALDALDTKPASLSTEEVLSNFWPNLETYRALQELGIDSPALKTRLDRTLEPGVKRLLSLQRDDGGWGWMANSDSDPYISAYVLLGLIRARQAGMTVDDQVIQKATAYLQAYLVTPQMSSEGWLLDRQAFILYALGQAGPGDQAGVSALYDVRDQINPWAQALLALSLKSLSGEDAKINTLLSDLESGAVRSASGVYWQDRFEDLHNMGSPVLNNAMVITAIAQLDPASTVLPDALRFLMSVRQPDGGWDSSYDTAWSLMALTSIVRGTGELNGSFNYEASLNGAAFARGQTGGDARLNPVTATAPLTSLYLTEPNALTITRDAGPGRLYYTASLNVSQPVENAKPLNRGLSVSRAYYPTGADCPQGKCDALKSFQAGTSIKVHVTLTAPHDAYYVMVEDNIPAGAEVLDTSLKTSQQGGTQVQPPFYEASNPFAAGWGWWVFQEPQVYDNRVVWSADYLLAGTYDLTYTLVILQPGEFRVLPARAWLAYFPDTQGTSEGIVFDIKPAAGP